MPVDLELDYLSLNLKDLQTEYKNLLNEYKSLKSKPFFTNDDEKYNPIISLKEKKNMLIKEDSDYLTFNRCLNIPELSDLLEEYCKKEYSIENYLLLKDINFFKKITNEELLKKTATIIFEKYLKKESLYEININKQSIDAIKELFENSKIDAEMYNSIEKDIKLVMTDTFSRFKNSDAFIGYIRNNVSTRTSTRNSMFRSKPKVNEFDKYKKKESNLPKVQNISDIIKNPPKLKVEEKTLGDVIKEKKEDFSFDANFDDNDTNKNNSTNLTESSFN